MEMPDMQSFTDWMLHVGSYLPTIGIFLAVMFVLYLIGLLLMRLCDLRWLRDRQTVFLEITPPASNEKTPEATRELFSILHGIGMRLSASDRLMRRKVAFSLEVVTTRETGSKFIMQVGERESEAVRHALTSFSPGIKIKEVKDYLPIKLDEQNARAIEYRLNAPFPFPLKTLESYAEYDPIAYLSGAMGDLAPGELIALQVVTVPAVIPQAAAIARQVFTDDDLLKHVGNHHGAGFMHKAANIVSTLMGSGMNAVSDIFHDTRNYEAQLVQQGSRTPQQIGIQLKRPFEQELAQTVHGKVRQPLFRAEVRVLVMTNSRKSLKQRVHEISGAVATFDTPHRQSLRPRYNYPAKLRGKYRLYAFSKRLPSLLPSHSSVLSASEVAGLYHFPTPDTSTENLVRSLSPTLPATLALKRGNDMDVLIGTNVHQGKEVPIGLTAAERDRHLYVVGGTGNGKTTMMQYAIVQDIKNGKGVAVLDPHGDMAKELLQYIPEERLDDVIYFNPDDLQYPISLNLLEIDPALKGDDLLRAQYLITEYTVEIFRKLFSEDDSGGSRIEAVLRNAIYTAFTTKDPTLFTIYQLITDKDYRKKVVDKLEDEVLKNFWTNEFDSGGEYQRVKMGFGVTTKVGRFLTAVFVNRIVGQPKSTIDFDDIINNGKILICNLQKGELVKDTSSLFGTMILARLQIAAQRRGRIRERDRRPFYVYVDEFQNFATTTFVDMLAEARKYRIHLFMAEQTTSQQDKDIVFNILANAGTVVCFSSGNPMDEQLFLPRFEPWVKPGEISNLPSYNFFARIKPIGVSDSQAPVSGETVRLPEPANPDIEKRVIAASRKNYAKKYVPPKPTRAAGSSQKPKSARITNPVREQR